MFKIGSVNENGNMTVWILMRDIARDMFDGLIGRGIEHQGPFMQ